MRILFLTHYFPPEVNAPASRTYEHCRAWVREGHEVTVLTNAPNHPNGVIYPPYRNSLWQREEIDGIRVIRTWSFLAQNRGFARRIASYLSYAVSAVLAAPFLPTVDVVVSTSPQFFCGLAGYPVAKLKRVPWTLEIRDLWPDSIETLGAMRNRGALRFLQALERFAYRKAQRIVSVTDSFVPHIVSRGAKKENVSVIKNGVDLSFFSDSAPKAKSAQWTKLEGKFVASYVGTHGLAHNLDTVLRAAELLQDQKNIVFLLVGDGAERKKLLELKGEKGLENVLMLPQQSKADMPTIWSFVDVSLITLKRSPVFTTVIPSKIFEALAMRKPVVMSVEGEASRLLSEARAGVSVPPEDPESLAEAVLSLARNPDRCRRLGENGRSFVESHFNRDVLAARLLEVLSDTIQKSKSPAKQSLPTLAR